MYMCVHARTKKSPHTNKSCHTHTSDTHTSDTHTSYTRISHVQQPNHPRVCMSRMNESYHTHTSHANKSCHTHTSHMQQPTPPEYVCIYMYVHMYVYMCSCHNEEVTSHEQIMPHAYKYRIHKLHTHQLHTQKSPATTYPPRVCMSHMNESYHTHTSHVTHTCNNLPLPSIYVTYECVNASCHTHI